MALTGFHLRVARLLGEATGEHGFALGGGYGLQAHMIVDRPSKDLDSYVNSMDTNVFERAEQTLCDRLRAEGLTAEVVHRDSWFRAIIVTGATEDEQVAVDLGYDYRTNPPVRVDGIGPVLDVEDVVTGKVRAFIDRGVERDYSDIDSILRSGRWTVADLFDKASDLFPDITKAEFADHLDRADRLDPDEYAAIGIGPSDLIALQGRLTTAGQALALSAHPSRLPEEWGRRARRSDDRA